MSVHKKLMQSRIKLNNSELKKSGYNKFAGYYYFELGDFLPQTQAIFDSLGLCGVVSYSSEFATLTITDIEDNSQIIITSPMSEANLKGCHPIQNVGACETYQRRYLWVTAMEIVEHDILNATAGKDKPTSSKSVAQDVHDTLPEETQRRVSGIADNIRALLERMDTQKAYAIYDDECKDNEIKIAVWSLLTSGERKIIKDFGSSKPLKNEELM